MGCKSSKVVADVVVESDVESKSSPMVEPPKEVIPEKIDEIVVPVKQDGRPISKRFSKTYGEPIIVAPPVKRPPSQYMSEGSVRISMDFALVLEREMFLSTNKNIQAKTMTPNDLSIKPSNFEPVEEPAQPEPIVVPHIPQEIPSSSMKQLLHNVIHIPLAVHLAQDVHELLNVVIREMACEVDHLVLSDAFNDVTDDILFQVILDLQLHFLDIFEVVQLCNRLILTYMECSDHSLDDMIQSLLRNNGVSTFLTVLTYYIERDAVLCSNSLDIMIILDTACTNTDFLRELVLHSGYCVLDCIFAQFLSRPDLLTNVQSTQKNLVNATPIVGGSVNEDPNTMTFIDGVQCPPDTVSKVIKSLMWHCIHIVFWGAHIVEFHEIIMNNGFMESALGILSTINDLITTFEKSDLSSPHHYEDIFVSQKQCLLYMHTHVCNEASHGTLPPEYAPRLHIEHLTGISDEYFFQDLILKCLVVLSKNRFAQDDIVKTLGLEVFYNVLGCSSDRTICANALQIVNIVHNITHSQYYHYANLLSDHQIEELMMKLWKIVMDAAKVRYQSIVPLLAAENEEAVRVLMEMMLQVLTLFELVIFQCQASGVTRERMYTKELMDVVSGIMEMEEEAIQSMGDAYESVYYHSILRCLLSLTDLSARNLEVISQTNIIRRLMPFALQQLDKEVTVADVSKLFSIITNFHAFDDYFRYNYDIIHFLSAIVKQHPLSSVVLKNCLLSLYYLSSYKIISSVDEETMLILQKYVNSNAENLKLVGRFNIVKKNAGFVDAE